MPRARHRGKRRGSVQEGDLPLSQEWTARISLSARAGSPPRLRQAMMRMVGWIDKRATTTKATILPENACWRRVFQPLRPKMTWQYADCDDHHGDYRPRRRRRPGQGTGRTGRDRRVDQYRPAAKNAGQRKHQQVMKAMASKSIDDIDGRFLGRAGFRRKISSDRGARQNQNTP